MRLSILWRIIEIEEVGIRAFSQSELGKYFEWIIISVNTVLSGVNFKIIFLARKPHRNTRISGASFFRFTLTFSLFAAKRERQNTRCGQWWRELSKTVRGTNKFSKNPPLQSVFLKFVHPCFLFRLGRLFLCFTQFGGQNFLRFEFFFHSLILIATDWSSKGNR